ncbi:MAG: class I SAM-dependent methyltransferase [Bacteroidia bacterium]
MSSQLIRITKCEVCQNTNLIDVLDLGLHPMCDDLVPVDSNWVCNEYPIDIAYCINCYTAHQKYQIPKAELFPKTYHYRARFTADVLNGMQVLVEDVIEIKGNLQNKKVLDIGCNDGSLLNFFKAKGAITYGIEPTDAWMDAKSNGHNLINGFFSVETAKQFLENSSQPDIITFTNVFAHIEDLEEVIDALKLLLHKDTIIVIENHYLGAVLAKFQFDTFYHEHPRTYSYKSFRFIAKSLGLNLVGVDFPSRYGGNIRVIMGNNIVSKKIDEAAVLERESHFFDQFTTMREKIELWKVNMRETIVEKVKLHGKLKAKAFPGRAAILVKMLNLDVDLISAAYEKPGSMKIGNYLPGTRIPIMSDEELFKTLKDEKVILNLAWHIEMEIANYLKANGFTGELLNILK